MSIGAGGVAIKIQMIIKRKYSSRIHLTIADQEFIDSLGEDVLIKAYFSEERNLNEVESLIREKINFISEFLNTGEGYKGYAEIDEEDWATSWKKYYKPLHITDNIVIKPSWEDYNQSSNEIVIELDLGMAFGTGTHETTKMCAETDPKLFEEGDTALDVGCGNRDIINLYLQSLELKKLLRLT
jgi:ribosomal protein L11 methyltransferase